MSARSSEVKYWQVAVGSYQRDYKQCCLHFGMAFVGGGQAEKLMAVEVGDRVVLKEGTSTIVAVGEVAEYAGVASGNGDKEWLDDFEGWELPGYCYVEGWHCGNDSRGLQKTKHLVRATVAQMRSPVGQEEAKRILRENDMRVPTTREPAPVNRLDWRDVVRELVEESPSLSAEMLESALNRIRNSADDHYQERYCCWDAVSEDETRAFLIIPLLLALGWKEEQIKLELNVKLAEGRGKVDIACFSYPYCHRAHTNPAHENCALIIESKAFAQGLHDASSQARSYAQGLGSCPTFVVSNGYCYRTYVRNGSGEFVEEAYLNLLKPRERYHLDPGKIGGSLQVLKRLLPPELRTT